MNGKEQFKKYGPKRRRELQEMRDKAHDLFWKENTKTYYNEALQLWMTKKPLSRERPASKDEVLAAIEAEKSDK